MSIGAGKLRLAAPAALLVLWLSGTAPVLAQAPVLPQPESAMKMPTQAQIYDGPSGVWTVGWEAEQYFAREQYAALEELFARLVNPAERLTDGRWRLSAIPTGISHHLLVYKRWDYMLSQIDDWRKQNPDSAAVDIVEAMILRQWAWSARGSGYASSVTPEGWKLFKEKLQRAEAVLLRSKDKSSKNPLWYQEYLEVALGLGWNEAEYRALYKAAIAQFPDYDEFYCSMASYLWPQWHGSVEAFDAYVNEAVRQTQSKKGKILYARLYWYFAISQAEDFSLFEESGANWNDMKSGFEQLTKAHPDSMWLVNNYATFACRAGDADTYRRLRKQIGDRRYDEAWPSNLNMEVCDERLTKPI